MHLFTTNKIRMTDPCFFLIRNRLHLCIGAYATVLKKCGLDSNFVASVIMLFHFFVHFLK